MVLDDIGPLQSLVLRDADLLPDVLQVAQRFVQARHGLRCEHLAAGTDARPGGQYIGLEGNDAAFERSRELNVSASSEQTLAVV